MANSPKKPTNDEDKFNETVKRMLDTPPTPHKPESKKKPTKRMKNSDGSVKR